MFSGLGNIKEIDLTKFDTSKVKSMSNMFYGCSNLEKINFGKINTSSVLDMSSLFEGCKKLISIDLSNFDTSSVTNMKTMFSHCETINFIDASSFNTSKVEIMFDMFGYCYKLLAVNMSSFDTSKVTHMQGMFFNCIYLKYLDLQNFTAPNAKTMDYIFGACHSLVYLNLNSFEVNNNLNIYEPFKSVTKEIKYCINDLNAKNKLIGNKNSDCDGICFKKDIKINDENGKCVETCEEFYNICFKEFPTNTKRILLNKKTCSFEIPDNFYLDKEDNIYKECYKACKTCSIYGNEENNNCNSCIDNYIFLNDSYAVYKNCYNKCKFYYYFEKDNHYLCTLNNSCPENYTNLIIEKNKCIEDCRKDDYYIYEFNNTCLDKCPNGTIYNNITNKCEEEQIFENNIYSTILIKTTLINSTNIILKNISEDNNLLEEDLFLVILRKKIINRELDDMIKNITINKKDYIVKKNNVIYQITTSENQILKENNEISNIDLLECENTLKEKYNINSTLPLIILKVDYKLNETLIPLLGYEIYHPINKSKLDLSYCNDTILLNLPALVDENKLFINNPNSNFYSDNCLSFTTDNGTDILIKDRKQEFIDNNLSLCLNNCTYINYSTYTKRSSCDCCVKNEMELISKMIINPNRLSNNFSSEKNDSNYLNINTMKCTKELFSKDGLKNNISSYIILIIILFFILSIILFIKCGYPLLENEINEIINLVGKIQKNNNNTNALISNANKGKNKKGRINKQRIYHPPIKKNNLNSNNKIRINKDKNSNRNLSNSNNINNLFSFGMNKSSKNKKNKNIKNKKRNNTISPNDNAKKNNKSKPKLKIYYNIFELDTFSYKKSIAIDKRTCFEYYISLLKIKHPIIFSFCPIRDYNSIIIKSCITMLSFVISYALNFIFFDEKTIHKIYKDKGKYDFVFFIPKISISFIVSNICHIILKYIFLSERNLLKIRNNKTANAAQDISITVKRNLVIKYTLFFILGIIFLSFFWMLLSSFGAVYQNTQLIVFENTLICFGISLVYPFFINIIPCLFRITSLKSETKNQECLYNFSKFLQIL